MGFFLSRKMFAHIRRCLSELHHNFPGEATGELRPAVPFSKSLPFGVSREVNILA